ncbi:MAG: transglutaminase domain-containing protein [Bacteroidota bacterium]
MNHKAALCLLWFQLIIAGLFSQQNLAELDYSKVDRHVLKISQSYESDIYELVDKLAVFDEKHLNFRAAFFWVAHNIKYDCIDYHKPDKYKKDQGWRRTIADTAGICGGYANLLKAICDRMNIECEVVVGQARGSWGSLANRSGTSHAWNRVKLKGKWYLTDPTWASGYTDDRVKTYTRAFNEHYFLAKPASLALSHFPKEAKWQLLDEPKTYTQFVRSPVVRVRQAHNPVQSFYPLNGIVTISHKQKLKFAYKLQEGETPLWINMQVAKKSDYLKAREYTEKNSKTVELKLEPAEQKGEYYVEFELEEAGEYYVTFFLGNALVFHYYYRLR